MALTSPGVEVQVIDESFYVSAEPGTRPLLLVASKENKTNGSGTGVAVGTLKANAGRPYLITSQRELTEIFGTPLFYKDTSGNPVHGGEQNEYGLQAAYSYLGVSNSAFVVRADIDLGQLSAQADSPSENPVDGTYWLDTQNSRVGVFEWNGDAATVSGGQKFTNKVPLFITDSTKVDELTGAPKRAVGAIGDYAVVAITTLNKLYYKNRDGDWVLVGSNEWHSSWPTVRAGKSNPTLVNGNSMVINGTTVTLSGTTIQSLADAINSANIAGITAAVVASRLEIYSDGAIESAAEDSTTSNAIVITAGTGPLVASTVALSSVGIATGTYYGPQLAISQHTQIPRWKRTLDPNPRPTGSVWVKTTDVQLGARWRVKVWNSNVQDWVNVTAPVYANNHEAIYRLDRAGGGRNIATNSLYVQFNVGEDNGTDNTPRLATFKVFRRVRPEPTSFVSDVIESNTFTAGTYNFVMAESRTGFADLEDGKLISFTLTGAADDVDVIAGAINSAGFFHVEASVDTRNRLVISHRVGGEIRLNDGLGTPLVLLGYVAFDITTNSGTANLYDAPAGDTQYEYVATNWRVLTYTASEDPPNAIPADGRLWYNSVVDNVDIMIHNGTTWVGYLDATSPYYDATLDLRTDPNGPIVGATRPTTQSDGTALRNGDIWIDTGDIENYPSIYKWDAFNLRWSAVDKTDQSTDDGILFADARYNTAGANSNEPGDIADLLVSNFLDFDAPDPDLYPRGMLLFNTRRSGYNVKRFVRNYIDQDADNIRMNDESMENYYPHRWINESGNAADGSGLFGRKAQRKVVVKALKAMTDTNQEIRDTERRTFNLLASPGYCELIANMIALNTDRNNTAFIVGDTPFRLASDATTLNDWGSNATLAADNGDEGLVSFDEYLGVYYPSGFTTDNTGNDIVVPASHMVLRTVALSDGVSFPWFAPAGLRRGSVSNASSIGYVDAQEGEFRSITLNEGQRDTLYSVSINPITFLVGAGLFVFGQKTRASTASSLDRVNVARLVVYLRDQLDKLAKPYIFEPNDKITRDEIKAAADSLMLELVGKRAIYDFLTVCDESNNTPLRIDRNELYLDIAIEPVKAVEFIYIPLRLKNTGEIAGL